LWGQAKNFNQRNLVLDGSYLAQFIPTDKFKFLLGDAGAYGFDMIGMNNRWSGGSMEANLQGFVADPQAIGVAAGMALVDPTVERLMTNREIITIPDLGISVQYCQWPAL